MAFIAVLEADLRALSTEARRKYPAVKDAAEHGILKLRSLSDPASIAKSDEVLKIFLLACDTKNVKLSTIGLACLQKLIAHDAVAPSALPHIMNTLKEHSDIYDESVQLKTLQMVLTVLQSHLHPKDEESMATLLGICLRLLGSQRSADSVHSTAATTLRQAVALIFDNVLAAEHLPMGLPSGRTSRSNSVSGDVSRFIVQPRTVDEISEGVQYRPPEERSRESLSPAAKVGSKLFEDLTALASGSPAVWLQVPSLPRAFALDMLEYVLSHYKAIFKKLSPFEQVLRAKVCSLLMTSLRATGEIDGEAGEPTFRRLVLRSVATVTRLYSSSLTTECEVFLSMLIKSTELDLPLWHRIMVLDVLRGFCVEARVLRLIFEIFDMRPKNTNVVADMVLALSRVVSNGCQLQETSEESLAAVAGMFSSKAKGVEWTMDMDAGGAEVVVASQAHAITLAVEGLLGVVFTVATHTDEAVDIGELDSPRCEGLPLAERPKPKTVETGGLVDTCRRMVDSVWRTLLDALSLMLARSQGEAVVLEILKGYQAFTQSCGVLRMPEPRDAFLASLCKFTLAQQYDPEREKGSVGSIANAIKRLDQAVDQREAVVLTPKNVQALRTLFNIAHRLDCVLGPSWALVLETLAALDRTIHAPHATTQEISQVVPRLSRDSGNQSSDFNILSTLDSQLFESTAFMSSLAVMALLGSLRSISNSAVASVTTGLGLAATGSSSAAGGTMGTLPQAAPKMFAVERMMQVVSHNLHRVEALWDEITAHLLELSEHESPHVRAVALDALDRVISAVIGGCERVREDAAAARLAEQKAEELENGVSSLVDTDSGTSSADGWSQRAESGESASVSGADAAFESLVVVPITILSTAGKDSEVRIGGLKILLHVLERHGEKLYHSWPKILHLLRYCTLSPNGRTNIANAQDKDFIPLGFQSVRVVMSDCLSSIPSRCLKICVEVAGAYGAQMADVNISLTAIGLLWTTADFFARGATAPRLSMDTISVKRLSDSGLTSPKLKEVPPTPSGKLDKQSEELLFSVYGVIQGLCTDERPEVRNTAIRTLFQSIVSHGSKLSYELWHSCVWTLLFPLLDTVRHLAAHSSKDEWLGKELGKQGGKPVHMLVHHSRNTAQKQWDETLVMVLNGMSRLLRSFFFFLLSMDGFEKGWTSLLQFVEEGVLEGSKEVALAAISTLHVILLTHAAKGTLPRFYWDSGFLKYETVVRGSASADSRVNPKARQELLQNLGELYVKCHCMFEAPDYLRLLAMVDVMARYPILPGDTPTYVAGTVALVQRSVLEVLPQLKPLDDRHVALWPQLLRQVLAYLPGGDHLVCEHCRVPPAFARQRLSYKRRSSGAEKRGGPAIAPEEASLTLAEDGKEEQLESGGLLDNGHAKKTDQMDSKVITEGRQSTSKEGSAEVEYPEKGPGASSSEFSERLIPVMVSLYVAAPDWARSEGLPDCVASLGRCMITRKEAPDSGLWQAAVAGLNQILAGSMEADAVDTPRMTPQKEKVRKGSWGMYLGLASTKDVDEYEDEYEEEGAEEPCMQWRPQLWQELVDVFESFVGGACGSAIAPAIPEGTSAPAPETVRPDEALELSVLDTLCDRVLTACQDAPDEVRQRLVALIDRCAAWTSRIPFANASELSPQRCRFSLACLHKLFILAGRGGPEDGEDSSAVLVARVALPVLIARCNSILKQFALEEESEQGEGPLPSARVEEVVFLLQELARLALHPLTSLAVDIPVGFKEDVPGGVEAVIVAEHQPRGPPRRRISEERFVNADGCQLGWERAQLFLLYTPLCHLVLSREARVRELLHVVLRLVGSELGLLRDSV